MQDEYTERQETRREIPKVSDKLQNYGPTIVGALVILIILVGGWFVWQRVQGVKPTKTQIVQQNPSPTSTLPIDKSTPLAQSPQTGITELPKAGFPVFPAVSATLLLLTGGIILRKISERKH